MNHSRLVRLALAALLVSLAYTARSAENKDPVPSTLYILIDGMRWDLLSPATPNMWRLSQRGVRGEMIPVWPTISMPNHWALSTGLYPSSSGIYHNRIYNPKTGETNTYQNPAAWPGEPIWATVRRHGGISAVLGRLPGSANFSAEYLPTYFIPYDDDCANCDELVVNLLDQEKSTRPWKQAGRAKRPQFLGVYTPAVDLAQHKHGIGSPQAIAALGRADAMIGRIVAGLERRNLLEEINIVVVADHGQVVSSAEQVIYLDEYFDLSRLLAPPESYGLWPAPGHEDAIFASLQSVPHLKVYRSHDIPKRLRCCGPNTPPLMLFPDAGWQIHASRGAREFEPGSHGYDNRVREMHSAFLAAGPGIRSGVKIEPFEIVDVYSLLAHLLSVEPPPTDGSIRSLCSILTAPPATCAERSP